MILEKHQTMSLDIKTIYNYSHLSNNRGGEANFANSLNVEAGINVEVGKYL